MSSIFMLGLNDPYTKDKLFQIRPTEGNSTVEFDVLVKGASEIQQAKDNCLEAGNSSKTIFLADLQLLELNNSPISRPFSPLLNCFYFAKNMFKERNLAFIQKAKHVTFYGRGCISKNTLHKSKYILHFNLTWNSNNPTLKTELGFLCLLMNFEY